jgi:CubicO group peptidase (beta-lactamase class C family)
MHTGMNTTTAQAKSLRCIHPIMLVILLGLLGATAKVHAQPAGNISVGERIAAPKRVTTNPPELNRADVEPWLDGFMELALLRYDIAGATVAVVKDGQVVLTKGYGYADVKGKVPVDASRHLFRIASITKLFTWTAVMQLSEQGKIDLDTDINHYLDFTIPDFQGEPLTMRQLMTHTAGFELVMRNLFSDQPNGTDLEATVKLWVPNRIYPPGTTPTYSNYGPALAGYIVERVSGEPFDEYIDRHILQPLAMTQSSSRQPPPEQIALNLSKGYMLGSGEPYPYEYSLHRPAGAMVSTAPDLARFMIAHLNDGVLEGNRILQPKTARMMHTTPYPMLEPLHSMGFGFYQNDINGRRVIVHDGDTRFFHSQLNLFVDDHVGIFVSFNSTGRDGAVDILRPALFTEFSDRYFPTEQVDGEVNQELAAQHAQIMVGHYQVSDRSASNFLAINGFRHQTEIEVNGKGNLVTPDFIDFDGAPKEWREIAPFLWRQVNGKERLAAQVMDGKPVRFSVDAYSPMVVWDKLPWWRSTQWLKPLSQAALIVLLLTIVAWPASLVSRRYCGKPEALRVTDRRIYLSLGFTALVGLLVPYLWLNTIQPVMTFTADTGTIDVRIITVSLLTLFAYVGGLLLALANARAAWKHRGQVSRLWSLILVISFSILAWIAWQFQLLSFSTDF